jgi:hypothetical protein
MSHGRAPNYCMVLLVVWCGGCTLGCALTAIAFWIVLGSHLLTSGTATSMQELAFVKNMEARIASARQVLDSHLQGVFSEALAARHWTAVSHCLHAYMELGDGSSAEAVVRQVLVAPVVKKIVAEHKAAHPVACEPRSRRPVWTC